VAINERATTTAARVMTNRLLVGKGKTT